MPTVKPTILSAPQGPHSSGTASPLQRSVAILIALALSLGNAPLALAQATPNPHAPGTQRPGVGAAGNGVPVVNITAPSQAGVSRNDYTQFNVQQQGLILNNSRTNTNTQLGGWIQGNPNLGAGTARIILNEVTGGNPSMLHGYIEVGGNRAEVIIANPAGITVNGGGFINASGVTLTTGTPQFNTVGNLESYRVTGNSLITINGQPGQGLDTTGADYTRIIASAVQVNSGIWANDLNITAGTGTFTPAGEAIQLTIEDQNGRPLYAIDVAQLGGMYAGKIRLIGTESGVGVRNAGHIGASAGQIQVTTDGQLINTGTINSAAANPAQAGIQVASAGGITNSGTIYTQGNLTLNTNGQLTNNGTPDQTATIAAQGNLTLNAQDIQNQQQALIAAGMGTDGKLTNTDATLNLTATQNLTNAGQIASSGNTRLQTHTLTNSGTINTTGPKTTLNIAATTLTNTATGTIHGAGQLNAAITGSLTNAGQITSSGNTAVTAQTLENQNTGLIGAGLDAQGQFTQTGNTRITTTQALTNAGQIYSGGNITLQAGDSSTSPATLTNSGTVQARGTLSASAHTINNSNARLLSEKTLTLQAQNLNNTDGLITSSTQVSITGQVPDSSSPATNTLNNTGGVIAASQSTDSAAGTTSPVTTPSHVNIHAASLTNTDGQILSEDNISLILSGNYTNAQNSQIIANKTLDVQLAGQLTNAGQLLAGEKLQLTAAHIDNTATGEISAQNTILTTTGTGGTGAGTLTNRGLIDGGLTHIQTDTLTNTGTGRIYGSHLAIQTNTLTNTFETIGANTQAGVIAARDRLDIGTQTLTNLNGAVIYSGGDMSIAGALNSELIADPATQGSATLIVNDGATIEAAGNLSIAATDIKNLNTAYVDRPTETNVGHETFIVLGGNGQPVRRYNIKDLVLGNRKQRGLDWEGSQYFTPGSFQELYNFMEGSTKNIVILPSDKYPFDQFGPQVGLFEIPKPAYVPAHIISGGDGGSDTSVPVYYLEHTSNLWTIFGVPAPALSAPAHPGFICDASNSCGSKQQAQYTAYLNNFNAWESANQASYLALNAQISEFKQDISTRTVSEFFYEDYDIVVRSREVTVSKPGQILSGGNMTLSGAVTNDKSRIIAGDNLFASNVTTIDAKADQVTQHIGTSGRSYIKEHTLGSDERKWNMNPLDTQTGLTQISLTVSDPQSHTSPGGSGTQVGTLTPGGITTVPVPGLDTQVSTVNPNITIPNNSLYKVNPGAGKNYLIETDPRFTNYGKWLTSDYMLSALGLDPSIAKRLGDGYYEQQLIREQIGKLTGYRFLAGYQSDEEQYRALMTAGAEFAKAYQLSIGIALTPEQMKSLTTDIVWLVSTEVTLPNGSRETVLVPQVYARGGASMITAGGSLISANNVYIAPIALQEGQAADKGSLINNATIAAREGLYVDVTSLQNLTGQLHGNDVVLQSQGDITNTGGVISADNSITMLAGRDVNISSTVVEGKDISGHLSTVGNTGVVYLSGQGQATAEGTNNGQIHIQAGRDINLNAAYISNDAKPGTNTGAQTGTGALPATQEGNTKETSSPASTNGSTTLIAGRNLDINTVTTEQSHLLTGNSRNWISESGRQEIGTQIHTQGDINLIAGEHAGVRGGTLQSAQGAINASANTITLEASKNEHQETIARYESSKGFLSSSSKTNLDTFNTTGLQGTSLSAEQINLQATQDLHISASEVVATGDVNLVSTQGNVTVQSGQTTSAEYHFERIKESGLLSGSGEGITIGQSQTTTKEWINETGAQGSTIGSLEGNVNILARQGQYTQTGSDVLALQGDINVVAQDISVTEARETSRVEQRYEFKQSGLTISISSPAISVMQTAQQMSDAADKTQDGRMQALAAGATALNLYNNWGGIKDSLGQGNILSNGSGLSGAGKGAFSISISLGASKAQSRSVEQDNSAKGSSMNAGGNINLVATGRPAGEEGKPTYTGGNITIQGSTVNAGNNATLIANDQINIVAASNTSENTSSNKSSSGSIGVSLGSQTGVSVGASQTKGKGSGNDQYWTASKIASGNTTILISGGDTNILGSQVMGNRVVADIGGNLNIHSLQDTSSQRASSQTIGGSITIGPAFGGSFNYSKSKVHGEYASVNEYAGIMAGDGGFDITVAGNTDLKGAIITSTENAQKLGHNQLITGTITSSDIANSSKYKGSGFGFDVAVSYGTDKQTSDPRIGQGVTTGIGKISGSEQSIIQAGVYTDNIVITDAAGQKERTGQTVDEAMSSIQTDITTDMALNYQGLQNNFDRNKALEDLNMQIMITSEFKRNAYEAIDTYTTQEHNRQKEILQNPNATEDEKRQALKEIYRLEYQRVFLETLTGVVAGNGTTSITKGVLQEAAIAMRQESLNNSKLFPGVVDQGGSEFGELSNVSETSDWYDGVKLGGVRVDLDAICGTRNERCLNDGANENGGGNLLLNAQNQVVFTGGDVENPQTLNEFLTSHPDAKSMDAIAGGIQGRPGRLWIFPQRPGNIIDKFVESFAGTHDVIGGQLPGFYDEGNTSRGRGPLESAVVGAWAVGAIAPSAPFAISDLVTPDLLHLIFNIR